MSIETKSTTQSVQLHQWSPLHPDETHSTAKLHWNDLQQLYSPFPTELCHRFELASSLYDDGLCDQEVETTFYNHIQNCEACQKELNEQRLISESFAQLNESLIDEYAKNLGISDAEALKSFNSFMDQFGEELSPVLEQGQLIDSADSNPIMKVEYSPKKSSFKKINTKVAFAMIAAAALLFAYGPALIETEIKESIFPEKHVSESDTLVQNKAQQVQTQQQALWSVSQLLKSPLNHLEAKIMKAKVLPHSNEQMSQEQFQVSFQNQIVDVILLKTKLNPEQEQEIKENMNKNTTTLAFQSVVSSNPQKQQIRIKLSEIDGFQRLEYIQDQMHIQWTAQGTQQTELLKLLAESQLAQH